jgi:hypothetical protein
MILTGVFEIPFVIIYNITDDYVDINYMINFLSCARKHEYLVYLLFKKKIHFFRNRGIINI